MTEKLAPTTLEILMFLKSRPNDSFTLKQLIETEKFGDGTAIIECMGYLVNKGAVVSSNGDNFEFMKDLDEESIQELRKLGKIETQRPSI